MTVRKDTGPPDRRYGYSQYQRRHRLDADPMSTGSLVTLKMNNSFAIARDDREVIRTTTRR